MQIENAPAAAATPDDIAPESLTACAIRNDKTGEIVSGGFDGGHMHLFNRTRANLFDPTTEGFLTSTGRFVSRKEAIDVCRAYVAWEKSGRYVPPFLTSDDAPNFSAN